MYYQQPQPQVQNKPTAAYILSLLGGIFGLLASLAFIGWGAWAYLQVSPYASYFDYYDVGIGLFGWGWTLMIGFGAWMLITSILVLVFAGKLKANPLEHTKWGALILVFSIIGVGGLLGLIGGILALVYKPQVVAAPYGQSAPAYGQQQYGPQPQQPYSQQPITRICPQCGRVVQENVKFCPNCGKQLN
jgi:rubredoxin